MERQAPKVQQKGAPDRLHRAMPTLPRFVLAASLAVSACGQGAEEEAVPERARLVVVADVERKDAVEQVEVLGDLHGEREVQVFAQLSERVRTLHVREGDRVRAGQPLLTLAQDLQSASLAQADAALLAAEASRDQLQADLARISRLVEQGAAPPSQLQSLRAQLRGSEAQVSRQRAMRRTAGQQRSRTVIRAPTDGVVAMLTPAEGDMVAPGAPICTVVSAEKLELRLRVTEQDYVKITPGLRVEIRPPALPNVVRQGAVRRVSPVLDSRSRTALVEVEVDNPDGRLRPGMVAEAHIEIERRPNVVLAPARALVLDARSERDRKASMFVYDQGKARRRSVTLGQRYGQTIEIVDGLRGDERVVVQGQHLLRDGLDIREQGEPSSPSYAPSPARPPPGEGA